MSDTSLAVITCEHDQLTDEQKQWLIDIARSERVCNDEIEIDDGETQFSRSDSGGYWIRGWIFVYDEVQESALRKLSDGD